MIRKTRNLKVLNLSAYMSKLQNKISDPKPIAHRAKTDQQDSKNKN